jgi:hypothetical protein
MIGNMGGTAGYRAFMYRLPKQHADLTMAMNSYADPTPALLPVLRVLATA